MENEKLSNEYIQKYDPLSDTFVVVQNTKEDNSQKAKKEPFSFFKFRNRTKAMESENVQPVVPPTSVEPTPPSQPTPPSSSPEQRPNPPINPPHSPSRPQLPNSPVVISRNLYNRLLVLGSLYETMASFYPQNRELFDSLYNETLVLQSTMLMIYQSLSGNNFRPEQNRNTPTLTSNLCQDLIIVQNYLQETIDLTLSLQRAVNVQSIDRQLIIIYATLISQKSKLSSLQASSCNN